MRPEALKWVSKDFDIPEEDLQAAFWIEYPDEGAWMARKAERRARKESLEYRSRSSFLSSLAAKAKKAASNEANGLE